MICFPPCKVNLGLNILAKRPDGYHDIETCFYPVPLTDVLEAVPADDFSMTFSGLTVPGRAEDNLCVKAYELLKNDWDIGPVKIHLHKIIPLGAGLGGGSSDAAFMLQLLNVLFALHLTPDQCRHYAAQLGSDCPFFVAPAPMVGEGRGERLSPVALSLKGYTVVLVKPNTHVSTAEAYAGVTPAPGRPLRTCLASSPDTWKDQLGNDFEKSIFGKYPVVADVKHQLYQMGAVYASMSGSGSCVFGLFEEKPDLKDGFAGMFYWSGELK